MIRMADDLDHVEVFLAEHLAVKMEPLVVRLRMKTLGRGGYMRLRALLTENAFLLGQLDETHFVMARIEAHWRWCPLRYLPIPVRLIERLGRLLGV